MEEKIFPKPAVAEYLRKYFIEVRLHYDAGPSIEANNDLQMKLVGARVNPYYVIVQPPTEKVLRKKFGFMTADAFLAFLRGHPGDGPPDGLEQR